MKLNDKLPMTGWGRPTTERGDEAVLMRAVSPGKATYTIGLHLSGTAVLDIRTSQAGPGRSRGGRCVGHQMPMEGWIGK